MAKKTTRKDLLKSEDEFLSFSSRALSFFSSHTRQLQIAGIAIAAVAIIFLAATTFYRHVNKKGQEAYNTAYSTMAEQLGPEMEPQKLSEVQSLFVDVVENHGMSRVADLAIPQLAFLKFIDGKYDEALSLYQDFKEKQKDENVFVTLSTLGLSVCHEANGDFDKAIDFLNPIASDSNNRFRETAFFTLIRLYRLTGDDNRAADLAAEFIRDFKGSSFEPIVKTYL
ncbi:MAG TPA: tetratricopeptide repeat protein [Desulfobacteraceae bacterium]|jgi:predicted negative regulator of RcsB-dependent stress response|nr:tetratricopeptide repeat protein [Desulfobacteraceae bacterium]